MVASAHGAKIGGALQAVEGALWTWRLLILAGVGDLVDQMALQLGHRFVLCRLAPSLAAVLPPATIKGRDRPVPGAGAWAMMLAFDAANTVRAKEGGREVMLRPPTPMTVRPQSGQMRGALIADELRRLDDRR
ncbi:hypothetical protein AU467_25795 [Mesorhizobium loti]|uniref:Uncharacterized protein n=1 Tax=Rhizobium loti TaxID=381 RepID=A0A101KRD7_RHILI|nr:hypothetical protein AU467_25795 [Mesorhizobium loti]